MPAELATGNGELTVTTQQQQPLTEAERNHILNGAIASRIGGGGLVGTIDTSTGHVSLRRTGPIVRKRSTTWAEIWYSTPMTHWARFLLNVVYCLLTCGCFLPFWFVWSFKAPKTGVLSVDEYGNQAWTPSKVSAVQRVMCVALAVVTVWWLFKAVGFIDSFNQPAPPPPGHIGGLDVG